MDRSDQCFAGKRTQLIRGTKGSHLVLEHPELRSAIGEHEFFFENDDGRLVLIFPLEDRLLVGTTDIRVDNPDEITITEKEVDYFFSMIRRVFPNIEVNRSHIVFTFSGVRPLAFDSVYEDQISRDHKIEVLEPEGKRSFPIFSLVGGKWTTFRALAEKATDTILNELGMPRRQSTANLKIGGMRSWQNTDIATLIASEDVVHLDDLIFRRTNTAMLGRATEQKVRELAVTAARVLGWNAIQTANEIARVREILLVKHRMDFNNFRQLPTNLSTPASGTEKLSAV